MMTLVRSGGYPYNLYATVTGEYTTVPGEQIEKSISQFVKELERGGDDVIAIDWSICKEYFSGEVGFMDIADERGIPEHEVSRGIYRMCELLSMYWRDNPNFSAPIKCFLALIIGRTGDTRAVDILRSVNITSNGRLLDYCKVYGTEFKQLPALKESSKKEIQSWVNDMLASGFDEY